MNLSLTIVKKHLVICDGLLQIYHAGIIDNLQEYDAVVIAATKYLKNEGFLDGMEPFEDIQVFDYAGKQIFRYKCGEV